MNWKQSPRFFTMVIAMTGTLVMLLLFLAAPQAGGAISEADHKVIAPKDLMEADGKAIVLWHDYGSFALYRVSDRAWQELPDQVRAQVRLFDEANQLLVGSKAINGRQQGLMQNQRLAEATGESLNLIQFVGPIKDEWLQEVEATGAVLVHYVANYGYMVWADAGSRQQLNKLAAEGTFLQLSMPYSAQLKYEPSLVASNVHSSAQADLVTVTIQLYSHGQVTRSKAVVEKMLVEPLTPWEPVLNYQNITGVVQRENIAAISDLPDVVWVGEYFARELNDEVQGQIMAHNLTLDEEAPSGPGYIAWLLQQGFSDDPKSYPIVDITDDGIGNGIASQAAGDVTLRELGNAAKPSRLAYVVNCTSAPSGAGPDGHGHLNVSIAGGYDSRTGSPFQDDAGYARGMGINPFGRFAGTRVFDEDGFDISNCGETDSNLIRESYNFGARILSNSWGCGLCAGVYDASSQAYDAGVRDADPAVEGNQELAIVFSSGNYGPELDSIGAPGNAKNVLTVGASENVRPTWTDGCGITPDGADSVQDIADFSSRGPAPGGRTKPDVVAPGTHVQATASTSPGYNGSGVCDLYEPPSQEIFAASSGTSHSAPAVAGMASLVYSYLAQNYGLALPSPALLKAFIVAHTSYLTGVGAGGDLPSQSQGFGLPDMSAAFGNTPKVVVEQSETRLFDTTGESWSLTVAAADPAKPVRVVMAFTDQPGATGRAPQVNDLNLAVQADGKTYLGNHMSGQWSMPSGAPDAVNTVEAVYLPAVSDPSLHIRVTAFNIAGDAVPGIGDETDQDFAIVCSNCVQQKDFTVQATPAANSLCRPGNAEYALNLQSILGFSEAVALSIEGAPIGVSGQFSVNPITPSAESLLTFHANGAAAAGSYPLQVMAMGGERTHSVSLMLDVFTKQPDAPALISPPSGTAELPLAVELTWEAVAQAGAYEVQIATDPNFAEIVENATGLRQAMYTTSALEPGRIYYWRVRAVNDCAQGQYSRANRLSTKQLPSGCPIGSTLDVVYSEDFEGAVGAWTHEGLEDTWSLSSAKAHSGNNTFYAVNLDTKSDQRLVTPAVKLPADASSITFQFWNYQSIENSELDSGKCFDGANLEISVDGGQTWQQLGGNPGEESVLRTDPYDGFVAVDHENPLSGQTAWCGDPQEWLNSVVKIDQFAGQTARFRFRLGTDVSIGIDLGHEGWYIDDVLVQACYGENNAVYLPSTFK